MKNNEIEIEILESSYWEHFKYAKDMALYLPIKHPKRIKINNEMNIILKRLHELKQ